MKVLETVLYAEDLESAYDFYTGVLGLPVISFDPARDLFLRLEDSVLIVFRPSKTVIPDSGVPPHGTVGAGHAAFCVEEGELATWRKKLEEHGVVILQEVTWANEARSVQARSLYFNDPAGNVLEFATKNLWF
ncbi:MAG: VOC family protein [Fimbriimonas sp.]